MRTHLRWFVPLFLIAVVLGGCTRERPTPEPVPTIELPAEATTTSASVGGEPAVVTVTAELTPPVDAEATPTPAPEEEVATFQYVVAEGDTLLGIALKYQTDTETVRQLNNLFTEEIQVGQPLLIPYSEGLIVPGMPTPTPGPFYYTVKQGDTIGSIAVDFGKDMIELIEANNLIESDILSVGQRIIIPDYSPTPADVQAEQPAGSAVGTGGVEHVVQQGETLGDIAAIYGVSEAAIARANNVANPNILRVGQRLAIPGVSQRDVAAARGQVHVVRSGESLSQIALQYGKDINDLMQANELNNANEIYVGQELIIPE